MAKLAGQVRSVLIPVTGERILLPNATVAEVITFGTPDSTGDGPDWLLGRVVWRGWRVPVFSLGLMSGWTERESEAGAKLAVVKALTGSREMPFMAMVTQGFPRLITVDDDSLERVEDEPGPDAGTPDEDTEASPGQAIEDFSVEMTDESLALDVDDGVDEESFADNGAGGNAVEAVVMLNGERAVIPNLNAIEQRVMAVL